MDKKLKLFLGGTCEGCYPESQWNDETFDFKYDWRKELVSMLDLNKIEYFNPVVDDWNIEAQQRELEYRNNCDICLYTITNKINGVYSIAEVIDDSNKRPEKTIFCDLYSWNFETSINVAMFKSIRAVGDMVERNDTMKFNSIKETAEYINDFNNIKLFKEAKKKAEEKFDNNVPKNLGLYIYKIESKGVIYNLFIIGHDEFLNLSVILSFFNKTFKLGKTLGELDPEFISYTPIYDNVIYSGKPKLIYWNIETK